MNIEIFKDEELLNVRDSISTDYSDDIKLLGMVLSNIEIDFQSITQLKGDKKLMELAFQDTKKELL